MTKTQEDSKRTIDTNAIRPKTMKSQLRNTAMFLTEMNFGYKRASTICGYIVISPSSKFPLKRAISAHLVECRFVVGPPVQHSPANASVESGASVHSDLNWIRWSIRMTLWSVRLLLLLLRRRSGGRRLRHLLRDGGCRHFCPFYMGGGNYRNRGRKKRVFFIRRWLQTRFICLCRFSGWFYFGQAQILEESRFGLNLDVANGVSVCVSVIPGTETKCVLKRKHKNWLVGEATMWCFDRLDKWMIGLIAWKQEKIETLWSCSGFIYIL